MRIATERGKKALTRDESSMPELTR